MSRKMNLKVKALAQRAGRNEASKTQASTYRPMYRSAAQQHVGELFPVRGKRTAHKQLAVVAKFKDY